MKEYKLLISHVAKDREIAMECVDALEKLGVVGDGDNSFKIVPIYMESETAGCIGDYNMWTERAVNGSDGVLAIITEHTAEKKISADGIEANDKILYREISLARNKLKDLLILMQDGISLQEGYELLLQNVKCAFFSGDNLDSAIASTVNDVVLHAKRRFGFDPLLEYAGKQGARLIPSVIADTSEYIGRTDRLAEIDRYFNDGKRVVCITGFGGMGKTTLAKMYAKAHPEDPVVLMYCSAEETGLKNAVVSLAMEYDSPQFDSMTIDEKYALRIRQLSNLTSRTLIIIDNFNADFGSVSNREVLTELCAIEKCRFIITSRQTVLRKDVGVVNVGKLDDGELIELFYRDSHCERNEQNDRYIKELIVRTNGHTMTIELAAKAVGIDLNGVSLPEIVGGFLSVDAVTNVDDRHDGYNEYDTIYAHLRELFNLTRIGESEKYLLGAMSFVARRGLTIGEMKSKLKYDTKDLIRLCALGYIVKTGNGVITYSLHPLMSELAFIDFVQDIEPFNDLLEYLIYEKAHPTRNDTLADLNIRLDYAEHVYARLSKLPQDSVRIRTDLSISCSGLGHIAKAKGDLDAAYEYWLQSYEIAKAVAEETGTLTALRNLSISCDGLGDIAKANGDSERAEQCFKESYELRKRILEATGTEEARQELSISCNRLGDIAKAKGDIAGAERYFLQSYEIVRAIAEETGTAKARRDLSISYVKLGDIARAKGDLKGAEKYYLQCYELSKAIAEETGTVEARRDLSVSCVRLGDISKEKGDLGTAKKYFMQCYELSKAIAEETGTVEARRDLLVFCDKLGEVLLKKGDLDGAERYFLQCHEISRAVARETGMLESVRDLGINCNMLGDVYLAKCDVDNALRYFAAAHEFLQSIADETKSLEARQDLMLICDKLGDILFQTGDLDGAERYFLQCYELLQSIVKKNMTLSSLRDLCIRCDRLGHVYKAKGDLDAALRYFTSEYNYSQFIVNLTKNVNAWRDLSFCCILLGETLQEQGEVDKAEQYYVQCYNIRTRIVEQTDAVQSRRDLLAICNKLGELLTKKGDLDAAARYYAQGNDLAKAIAGGAATFKPMDDLIVSYIKKSEKASSRESALSYLLAAFQLAEGLYSHNCDINGRYKELAQLLSDAYKEAGDQAEYEKMQKLLQSLS